MILLDVTWSEREEEGGQQPGVESAQAPANEEDHKHGEGAQQCGYASGQNEGEPGGGVVVQVEGIEAAQQPNHACR